MDDIRTWSVLQYSKVMCKISAQYLKSCRKKVRKTAYLWEFEVKRGHNSSKNWRKLTAFELAFTCIKIKWYTKFQLNISKHVGEKCGKLWRTDGWTDGRTETRTDGRTDGHHHTIIRPVWRRAYKKEEIWLSPMTKTPTPTEKSKKNNVTT